MTIGLAMIVSGMMANPLAIDQATTPESQSVATASASTTQSVETPKIIPTNAGIEKQVRTYFADIPVMAEIARCESQFRQYSKNGEILRGKVNTKDIGVMQINESYHLVRAQKLGYDLTTVEGNMRYARRLYNESGSQPWVSSSPCWGKTVAAANDPLGYSVKVATVVQTTAAPVQVTQE